MSTTDEYQVGTVVLANVLINSITTIKVQLMRRDNIGSNTSPRAWVSAVPIGPVGVYVVSDQMVNVLEVLYVPQPEPIDLTEPTCDLVAVEFHDDDELVYLGREGVTWIALGSTLCQPWPGWLRLWEANHAAPAMIHRYERVGP